MKAEIISIGDELLIGQVVNSNASWMAEQLNLAGIPVVRITTISDEEKEILSALSEASSRADVILMTGGLGPTRDDITKHTLCKYFDTKLVFHQASYDNVEKLFLKRFRKITAVNRAQAEIPENCTPILNEHGTAPGMWFEQNSAVYVSMPGVPYEMQAMMKTYVLPELAKRENGQFIAYKMILTQGLGESALAEIIQDWELSLPENVKLAYLPQPGIVRLRLTAIGPDRDELQQQLESESQKLVELIPRLVFGFGDETLEENVGKLLKKYHLKLSTAESCTGGYIAHLITSIAGSSAYFTGTVVAYDNTIKTGILGVQEETIIRHGAVSEETVSEMAEGVKMKFGTDYSIAISGVAGPGGGSDLKPVGTTWIAISGPEQIFTKKYLLGNHRQRNIRVAALIALNQLRLMIEHDQARNRD
jgi:nicotinamide-nucleotide amidase